MEFNFNERLNALSVQLLSVFVICTFIGLFLSAITYGSEEDNLFINLGVSYCIGYSSWLFESILDRTQWIQSFLLRIIMAIVLGSVIGGYLGNVIFLSDMENHIDMEGQYIRIIILGLFFSGFAFYIIYSQISLYQRREQLADERRKIAEQEQLLAQSRLVNLQAQIEPHFLFNTMANIHSRIESSPNDAKVMLEHLTQLLRARINNDQQFSHVAEEVSVIEHYLAIQSLRLGERLSYQITVAQGVEKSEIPPLIIQPLVENAITHGIEQSVKGGRVSIVISSDADQLIITVSDNGVGIGNSERQGAGIALNNIRQRLHALYGNNAMLTLTDNNAGETEAKISIPMESI